MSEKTFRDELAMLFDTEGYTFESLQDLFRFAGHEYSREADALKAASMAAQAKLRYMYADAMLRASGRVEKTAPAADADGWIVHDGKGMPCDKETVVDVKFRDDDTSYGSDAMFWDGPLPKDSWWNHQNRSCDIIAWRHAR
jgi:hypothetical protein